MLSSGLEIKLAWDVGTDKQFDIVEVDCGVYGGREPRVKCQEVIGVKDVLVSAIVHEVEESSVHDVVLGAEAG